MGWRWSGEGGQSTCLVFLSRRGRVWCMTLQCTRIAPAQGRVREVSAKLAGMLMAMGRVMIRVRVWTEMQHLQMKVKKQP